eukprot:2786746-Rhodomonas_salina.1
MAAPYTATLVLSGCDDTRAPSTEHAPSCQWAEDRCDGTRGRDTCDSTPHGRALDTACQY